MTRPPLANLADVVLERRGNGRGFAPPGKKAWTHHLQYANEEMFVILEGSGTLRYEGETR